MKYEFTIDHLFMQCEQIRIAVGDRYLKRQIYAPLNFVEQGVATAKGSLLRNRRPDLLYLPI
jgi:hypothetical protein